MTRETIVQRIMQCTPEDLQLILDIMHGWAKDLGDELAGEVKTVQDIINLLSRPEYIQEAEECESQTGEDYFEAVFGL